MRSPGSGCSLAACCLQRAFWLTVAGRLAARCTGEQLAAVLGTLRCHPCAAWVARRRQRGVPLLCNTRHAVPAGTPAPDVPAPRPCAGWAERKPLCERVRMALIAGGGLDAPGNALAARPWLAFGSEAEGLERRAQRGCSHAASARARHRACIPLPPPPPPACVLQRQPPAAPAGAARYRRSACTGACLRGCAAGSLLPAASSHCCPSRPSCGPAVPADRMCCLRPEQAHGPLPAACGHRPAWVPCLCCRWQFEDNLSDRSQQEIVREVSCRSCRAQRASLPRAVPQRAWLTRCRPCQQVRPRGATRCGWLGKRPAASVLRGLSTAVCEPALPQRARWPAPARSPESRCAARPARRWTPASCWTRWLAGREVSRRAAGLGAWPLRSWGRKGSAPQKRRRGRAPWHGGQAGGWAGWWGCGLWPGRAVLGVAPSRASKGTPMPLNEAERGGLGHLAAGGPSQANSPAPALGKR